MMFVLESSPIVTAEHYGLTKSIQKGRIEAEGIEVENRGSSINLCVFGEEEKQKHNWIAINHWNRNVLR